MRTPEVRDNMPGRARLSIGLPVYNGDRYLAQAIDSLLGQTFSDFRLVICDNASSDGTEEVCRSYARLDPRIEYHRSEENRGAAWNFNRAFRLTDSVYFKWAACDDLYAPEFLERCVEGLQKQPDVILCYSRSQIIDGEGKVIATYRDPANATAATPYERFKSVVRNPGLSHMMFGVIRTDVLRATQLHGAYPGSDAVLLAELALRGRFVEVDEPLFFWRDHAGRASRAMGSDAELAVWFAPENAGRPALRYWTLLANYLRTTRRVPLPPGQRLRCAVLLAYWSLRRLGPLRREAASLLHRRRRPPASLASPADTHTRVT